LTSCTRSYNTISHYTPAGDTIDPNLIVGAGLNMRVGIAISGSDFYVTSALGNKIGKYSASGQVIDPDLNGTKLSR
jgi:hypothetical protein